MNSFMKGVIYILLMAAGRIAGEVKAMLFEVADEVDDSINTDEGDPKDESE